MAHQPGCNKGKNNFKNPRHCLGPPLKEIVKQSAECCNSKRCAQDCGSAQRRPGPILLEAGLPGSEGRGTEAKKDMEVGDCRVCGCTGVKSSGVNVERVDATGNI